MSDTASFIAALGMIAGAATVILGVAQLTCEHARSSWTPRFSTFVLTVISGWVGIDCWESWSGAGDPVDWRAVVVVATLAVSWAHRRIYRLTTGHDRAPKRA